MTEMKLGLLLGAAVAPLAFAMAAHAGVPVETAPTAAVEPAGDSLIGRVVGANGAPLPGAEIIVRGTGRRAVSNTQGEFSLPGVSGDVMLDVRYIGLPGASQSVAVTPGVLTSVTVVLGSGATTTVDDVIVTGVITEGVARSLNQQKNADGTINVLSADAIGRYPDPNVAESLQRVAGIAIQRDQGEGRYINVRGAPSAFTAVSVDGVTVPAVDPGTRAVDLDTLPSDIVSTVEISKTLLPSQDADSIAGAVNITTRSAFDDRRLAVSGYGGGSYNDYGGEDVRAGGTVSNVFGPNQTVGALLSVSYSRTNRRPENIESGWTKMETPDGDEVFALEEALFKDYDTERTRQAVTGALEFRPSNTLRAWVRGSYAEFKDDEYRNQLLLTFDEDSLQNGATDRSATFEDVTVGRQLRHRTQVNEILTLAVGGERTFGNGAVLDASLSMADSSQTYPNRNELLFQTELAEVSYDFSGDHYQPFYSIFATGEHLDASSYTFRENVFRANTTDQEEVAFQANLELPSTFGGRDVTWKFGGKYRTRDVTADEERLRGRGGANAPAESFADLLTDEESRNYDYLLGYKFNNGMVDDYFSRFRATSGRRMPDSVVADYEAQEDVLAAYGQARFDIGATNVVVGLRVEQTRFDGSAPTYAIDENDDEIYSTATVSRDDTGFFPNLTVRHSFSDNLIGRFALTRSISRPEFSQIVPRRVEESDNSANEISYEIGNPDLQPTLSNNIDAGLEYYFASLGVISANAFYKDLSDYRYVLNYEDQITIGGQVFDAEFETPINAPDGHIAGLELNWQQKFTFLPGWMSGLGVFANYTWTDAEIETAQAYGGRNTFALPGQSDTNYNVAVFYENAGFSARLSYTKRSDYLEEINADDADFDLYVEGREQLDFTASYDFGNGIEAFTEAKNLTNSAGVRYYGSRERTYEYEKFGYNVFFGLRFKM